MNDELLAGCRRGEPGAWAALVERYERLVYTIALRLGLSGDDAADVTQSTFAALLSSLDAIDEPDRLGAWLSTVARRQSIRVIERRDANRRVEGAVAHDLVDSVDDDEAQRRVADVEWLHQGLAMIGDRCRRVLEELFFNEAATQSASPGGNAEDGAGRIYEAAAARLGIPVGSLGPTRRRCLESLRVALTELSNDAARSGRG